MEGVDGRTRLALYDKSVRFSIALVIPKQLCKIEPVKLTPCTHIALSSSRFSQPSFLHHVSPVPPFVALRHIQTATLVNILFSSLSLTLISSIAFAHTNTHRIPKYRTLHRVTAMTAHHGV